MKNQSFYALFLASAVVFALSGQGYSQPEIEWERYIIESPYLNRTGFISTDDNSYIIVGNKYMGEYQDTLIYDGAMRKVDENGRDVWDIAFGDSTTSGALLDCFSDNNGNYLSFGGTGFRPLFGGNDIDNEDIVSFGLVKVNRSGQVLWETSYSLTSEENDYPMLMPYTIFHLHNRYYAFGRFSRGRSSEIRPFLMELEENGDSVSTTLFGIRLDDSSGFNSMGFRQIFPLSDSVYVIVGGHTYRQSLSPIDSIRVVSAKVDKMGEVHWFREYPGKDNEELSGFRVEESKLLLVGYRWYFDDSNRALKGDVCIVIKINLDGEIEWRREFTSEILGIDAGYPIIRKGNLDEDGNYVLAGYYWSYETESYDICIMKINPYGRLLWTRTYNHRYRERNLHDSSPSLATARDGGYTILAPSYYSGIREGYAGLWLFKTEPDFVSVPDVRLPLPAAEVSVYPNPFSEFLTVQLPPASGAQWSIRLFDLQGRVVYSISNLSSGQHNSGGFIDLQNLNSIPSGAYFLDLRDQNNLIGRTQIWKFK